MTHPSLAVDRMLAHVHPQSINLYAPRTCCCNRDDFLAAVSPGWRMEDMVDVDTHTFESDILVVFVVIVIDY